MDGASGIFRASQRSLNREAIVKVLPPGRATADVSVQRFLRETRLAARLDHPYAAHVYASGAETDGLLWIAMELVRGTPLDLFIREQGPLPLARFAPFAQRLAEVVDAAHEAGIVHRDIKPANVMAVARAGALFPKLLDFGVAAALEADSEGGLVGSPHYMAPEQWAQPAQATRPSDLYSLGVLAFEVLTGSVPFDGRSLHEIARAHATAPVPALPDARLHAVLEKALAKRPQDRYPTAQAFAEALREVSGRVGPRLPQLPEALRDSVLVRAPQPLAEAVADLAAASHPHQALNAIGQLLTVAVRLVALMALAARMRAPAAHPGERERALLRGLRLGALSDGDWLALAQALVAPHAGCRDAYPIPELIDLLAEPTPFGPLLSLYTTIGHPGDAGALEALEKAHPLARALVEALSFLDELPLIVGAYEWMGVRRERAASSHALADGAVGLASRDGGIVLRLDPLLQVHRPVPSGGEELFLFDGSDGDRARLVAGRAGFVVTDPDLWPLLEARLGLDDQRVAAAATIIEQSPYLGLSPFSASEAANFVGRERELEAFLNRLRIQPLVGIVGPSGAGKSSFIGAGVIPALSTRWRVVLVRPGLSPLETLCAGLAQEGFGAETLRHAPFERVEALASSLREHIKREPLVVIVDQLEELFTLCPDEAERERYADILARLAHAGDRLRVVLAVRDDFLVSVERLPALRGRLAHGFQLLSTPAASDLVRILVEPARRVGYDFDDPRLPEEMATTVVDKPGALALLSFAALRLWEQRDRYFRRLTRAAYVAMGGVGGALAQHAEAMLTLMAPEERAIVRVAFRRLVTSAGTRAVVDRAEMLQALGGGEVAERVIERMIAARLIVASDSGSGGDQLEVIHEALLAAWPRLVEWRREDAEGSRLREQLRAAALQWHQRDRPRGLLWRDDALDELRVWRTRFPQQLSDPETAFVSASLQSARRSLWRRRSFIGAALIALSLGLVLLRLSERRASENARRSEMQVALAREEKGREALGKGDPMRAQVYFADALRRGRDGPALRYALGASGRALATAKLRLQQPTRLWEALFTPGGRHVVTAGEDGIARVWNAQNGALEHELRGHQGRIVALDVSPDGKRVVTGGDDGTARLWDVESGNMVRNFAGHAGTVWTARFVPHSDRVLTACRPEGVVRIWDPASPEPVRTWTAHAGKIWEARFSPDGLFLVTAGSDAIAKVWSVAGGPALVTLTGHQSTVMDAVFSPDGRRIATAGRDGSVRLWDAATGQLLHEMKQSLEMTFVLFSADGKRVLAGGDEKVVYIWDVDTGGLKATLAGHTSYVYAAAFGRGGDLIATASNDGTVGLWDTTTGIVAATLHGHTDTIWRVSFDDRGRRLVTAGFDGLATVWDIDDPELTGLQHPDGVVWASFSADGRKVRTTARDGVARVWHAGTGELLSAFQLTVGSRVTWPTAIWDRDGRRLLFYDGNNALLVDPESGASMTLPHTGALQDVGFSPDGSRAITSGQDGTRLWDAATGKPLGRFPWDVVRGGSTALSRDGSRIATVMRQDILVSDVATGETIARLAGDTPSYRWVEFSPDGRQVAAAGEDRSARIWDIAEQRLVRTLAGHHSDVIATRFSPDGKRLATAGTDGLTNLWDLATGELLISFQSPRSINSLAFSPDGTRLVTSGEDRFARIWRIEEETRSPDEIDALIRCAVPFRLDGANLVSAPRDPRSCR